MDGKAHHLKAEELRENGDYVEALKHTDEATVAYVEENNIVGLSEVQSSRFLIFRHLFEQTNNKNYLILAKYSAKSGAKIAKKSDNPASLAIPLFNLGKAYALQDKLEKAIEKYKDALKVLPQSPQSSPAVKADIMVHLGIAEYKNGDKSALSRVEESIGEIEQSDTSKFEKNVWVSGGYLKLAEALSSKEYLEKARSIINANPDLKLRQEQLERLESKLK